MALPFVDGFSVSVIVALFGVLTFAGLVRGAVGFAFPMIATPFLMQVIDPKVAIVAMLIPVAATNGQVLLQEGIPWAFGRTHILLLAAVVAGAVVGVVGLASLPVAGVLLVMSGYLFFYLGFARFGGTVDAGGAGAWLDALTGGLTGLLGGTIGMAAPPIVTYLHAKAVAKATFVPTLAAVFLLIQFARLPTMVATELMGPGEAILGTSFLVPSMLGTYLGIRLRGRVSQRRFEAFVEVVLFLLAIKLALDGLGVSVV